VSIRRGADKSLAFPIFLFASQPKEFFFDGLKKSEQRCHKCGAQEEYVEEVHFFNPLDCFIYKAKELSAAPRMYVYIYIPSNDYVIVNNEL
jgi:hypothetical protein